MNNTALFCIRCGTRLQPRPVHGHVRPACPACQWVYFEDPKVAAAVALVHEGKFLLTQRRYNPGQGLWALPAGFVDAGEDPARAAERECLEETGLVVRVTGLRNLFSGREHPHGADIVLVYGAALVSGELKPGDDAISAGFFALNDLPPLAFKSTHQILENNDIIEPQTSPKKP